MTEPTLLVVDPNPATVRRIEEAFAGMDLRVRAARDASEADPLLEGANLVVALISASLPRGNGYELSRALRERFPATAILVMTGGFEVYNRTRAEECGVTGHLGKPFSVDGVRQAVLALTGPLDAAPEAEAPAPPPPAAAPEPAPAQTAPPPAAAPPLTSAERVATILPREYQDVPIVAVDAETVGPALERAVMEVLPEVVEALLRNALVTSPAFRDLVSVAVEEAVRAQLPAIASRVVEDRLAVLESTISHTD